MVSKIKWPLLGIVGIGAAIAVYFLVFRKPEVIIVTQEVKEIQEVFKKAKEKSANEYDLEETIRIIHGLDKARTEANNFDEFFEYMQIQDYSNVAPDVIEAKSKLLPILNELKMAEEDLDEANELWATFAGLSEVMIDQAAPFAVSAVVGGGFNPGMVSQIVDMGQDAFSVLEKQKNVKEEIKGKITSIREDYLSYLHDFSTVYYKYMNDWDKLCLVRDRVYLEIHQGNIDAALLSSKELLQLNPDDSEGRILRSLCLIIKLQEAQEMSSNEELVIDYTSEAETILESYLNDHPDRSAPALLLLGSLNWINGNIDKAISLYDQSAVEYPRQSDKLLDMLNSYEQRSYLRKTAEGMLVLELYKATMEGFGLFSPNFQKAIIALNENDINTSKKEIVNHFFRRGNQGVYDYLISDMIHCETYLPESFNLIFQEKSFLDLEASTSLWDSDELNIKIINRSDVELSNVRVFLCIHFTDMHKDDYEVFKVATTVNKIEAQSTADFGSSEVVFDLYGKKKSLEDDIVTIRAIVVTDDIITWVDKDRFKFIKIKESYEHYQTSIDSSRYTSLQLDFRGKLEEIRKETDIKIETSYISKDLIKIKLPRFLVQLNPYFSINELDVEEAVIPYSVKLNGPFIEVEVKHNIPEDGKIEFYMSSQRIKLRWNIYCDQEGNVDKVETNII